MTGFLYGISVLTSFSVFFSQDVWIWTLVALQLFIQYLLANRNREIASLSLFWPIFLVSQLTLPWPWSFIIPIVVFLIIRRWGMNRHLSFIRSGRWTRSTWRWMIGTILISSAALVGWVKLAQPDLSDIRNLLPGNSVGLLIIYGLTFSVFNAAWEELILKGILWEGMRRITKSIQLINLFQGLLFGVMHLNGFPRGIIGALMAGIYGLMIGVIRHKSDGLVAPVITHFFADATIFIILAMPNAFI